MTRTSLMGLSVLAIALSVAGPARAQDTDACISASESSIGLRKAGKLLDARAALSKCAAAACPDAVRTSCEERLAEVSGAIPSVIFFARDASGHDLAAVSLAIDGKPYADHLDGTAIVLDPGQHEFRFAVRGHAPVMKSLLLHQGDKDRREEVVVVAAPVVLAPPPPETADERDPGHARRMAGLVVGGVGVVGVITGAILGGVTLAARSSYLQHCGMNIGAKTDDQCNQAGVDGQSTAAAEGTASTVAFIVGGAAVVAGVGLYLTAPKASSSGASAQVRVGPGSLAIEGSF